ncbi:MAG TPA: acyl carrier protein, partial [Nitrospirae bacterium]|nr:acyl carrier protein [Nitrospirota bacterium]
FGRNNGFADSDSFLESGIIDSTGVLELVAFLEERYRIDVVDEELIPENLDSIDNLVRFVKAKMGGE